MLKEDLRFRVPVFFFPQFYFLPQKSGKQFKFPKSKYDRLYHHVMTPEVHILNEQNLGCASSSGIVGNTRIALSSLGLEPGFSFLFPCKFTVLCFFLHRYIRNSCHSLDLNLSHLYILLVLLTHRGHAGRGQACCLAVAAVGSVHLNVAAHAGMSSQAGG